MQSRKTSTVLQLNQQAVEHQQHLAAYRARRQEWLARNGYHETALMLPAIHRDDDLRGVALLDHGFTAIHVETGRLVMIGDPYAAAFFPGGKKIAQVVANVEQRYGVRIRQFEGLWMPGETVLFELWVVDPVRAVGMFDTNPSDAMPIKPEVRDTSRFLADAPQYANVRRMRPEEAVKLLKQAMSRIERPSGNFNGGDMQVGGIYWRLAQVLGEFAAPRLDEQEGAKHAAFIRKTHGVLAPAPLAAPAPDDEGDVF